MNRGKFALVAMAGLLMNGSLAFGGIAGHGDELSGVKFAGMDTTGQARPPVGHIQFCKKNPDECVKRGDQATVTLDKDNWTMLLRINHEVNRAVSPVTDMEYYKTEEYWTLPDGYGDCEDYVLLKQRMLLEQGWPSSALLITVVFDENNAGHAILIARTDRGDFVLDNKVATIKAWYETPYRYVKRQSEEDPRLWVSIDDRRHMEDGVASIR